MPTAPVYAPGPFAFLIFFLAIPIAAVIFSQNKPRRAAFLVVIGGTMTLPELVAVDPPILPAINKHVLVCALTFVMMFFTSKNRWQRMRLLRGMQLFFFILVIGNIGTAQTNPESFVYGGKLAWEGGPRFPVVVVSPLKKTEFIAMSIEDSFRFLMPFAVGQLMVQDKDDLLFFLKAYAFASVLYVPLMLFEGVMSPQLHRWVYGYHAVNMAHNVRGNGFKPVVFTQSGLGLAMLQFVGLGAALVLWRLKQKVRPSISGGMASGAILFALAVSRNVGVLIYIVAALPLIRWMSPRMMTRVGFFLAMMFLTFPITRANDWFPADDIIAYAESKSPERAQSLAMRFENEEILIEHTKHKPYWGWGSFGRNRVYDPDSGQDISVTDGEWGIHYSVRGMIGVVGWFWLMALPCLWGARFIRKVTDKEDQILLGAVTLIAAINAVDMLPNSSFTMVPMVFSGVLAGFLGHLSRKYKKPG